MTDHKRISNSVTELKPILTEYSQKDKIASQGVQKEVLFNSADTMPPPQYADPVIFTSCFVEPFPRLQPVTVELYPPTMFGRVPERHVTFCIDTSGSMFYALDVVKEQLIETLYMMNARHDRCMFNVIEFNTNVTKWSDKMVPCTPTTLAAAKQWISSLRVKTETNTQDALLSALSDSTCQAVYLVTDGVPGNYTEEVVDKIIGVCNRCRIHCIYLSCENIDEDAVEFLEDLAVNTWGSLHIVELTSHGCVDRVSPIYRADHSRGQLVQAMKNTLWSSLKTRNNSTTLQFVPEGVLNLPLYPRSYVCRPFPYFNTRSHDLYPYYWSRWHSGNILMKDWELSKNPLVSLSPAAGNLLIGRKVIARRKQDGYFYKGTVKSQVSKDTFLVAFPPCRHYNNYQTEYEDVSVFEIVDFTATQNRTIAMGDRVLASYEKEQDRFAPGIVGTRHISQTSSDKSTIIVHFKSGEAKQVPEDAAVLIPPVLYESLTQDMTASVMSGRNLTSTMTCSSLGNGSE